MNGQPSCDYLEALVDSMMRNSTQGDADSVVRAVDAFCWSRPTMNLGDTKGALVDAALLAARPRVAAELGSFLGYSTVRLASLLGRGGAASSRLYSIDPSPIGELAKRALLSRAGLDDGTVENVYGYSSEWIRTAASAGIQLDFLFIDHVKACRAAPHHASPLCRAVPPCVPAGQGGRPLKPPSAPTTQELYLSDLKLCLEVGLLAPGATVVADNVLTPGAPDYKAYMLEGEGARLFSTTVHQTKLEYSDDIPDEVLVSVLR